MVKLKNDIPAGLVVFLVALPLCLGIALASGAPPLAGIISGIIGGIIVGMLSGSHTSVSGPAAGLAAVVFSAITQLGSFPVFLLAVMLAGCIQFIAGVLRAGFIASYIPTNVIKGLLAAIGILLILKQVPQALGNHSDIFGDFSFNQADHENTFTELWSTHNHFSVGTIVITIVSFLILITYEKTPLKRFKFLPASLLVVLAGVGMNAIFESGIPFLYNEKQHLVNLPGTGNLDSLITMPDFAAFTNYRVWLTAATIAIVASLETMLNLEAVDSIDPHKRQSPPNRELKAQGIANILAGLIGGLPVTSVIVRSSVNINSGAQTKMSAIIHGLLLLASIVLLGPLLNYIPLASLAAILIFTGYKLAKISLFKEIYARGWSQFIPFISTITAIIFTDLLLGILIGLAVSIFYLLKSNYRTPFIQNKDQYHIGEVIKFDLPNQVSFLNKASIKDALWGAPEKSKILIDASASDYIDNDILELIEDYKTVAKEKNIQLNIIGVKDKYQLSDHIEFLTVIDKKTQQQLSPVDVLDILKAGNERFVNGKWNTKTYRHQVNATSMGQHPMAVVLGCIDSRTSHEIIFDAGIGDLLSIRIAGNIINPEITGSIELAVKEMGVRCIVILGHTGCGAINAAIHGLADGNIGAVTSKIRKVITQHQHMLDIDTGNMQPQTLQNITWLNVLQSAEEIISQSPYLAELLMRREIAIAPAYYNITSGKVYFNEND